MAGNYGGQNYNDGLMSWIIVVIALVIFWPVGLFLLFRKLTQNSGSSAGSRHPYDVQRQKQQSQNRQEPGTQGIRTDGPIPVVRRQPGNVPKKQQVVRRSTPQYRDNSGRGLLVGGGVLAGIFGFISFTELLNLVDNLLHGYSWWRLEDLFIPLGVCGVGLVLLSVGLSRGRKAKRFRKYLALIGRQDAISVETLAQAMPVSLHTACDDLQEMLDKGILPVGYLDMGSGRLILSDEGIQEEPAPKPEPKPGAVGEDERILAQIRAVNDAIEDEEMSRKIDRIEEITRKIFAYQKKNPEKAGQLRSFLNYYLPTTLKILNAYAQMEEQGVEGANITAAKVRIEGMMDKVVEGYEKQLDRLFENEAMDITTDVQVLEQMLEKDGLSQQWEGLTLNG
ncbi:MAG TPA: 5-bromo-4-chloroindolyl phosphate hydrolysis family protein [Candidatus Flavonifractor merdigallinarum]|uniref:5-bromo-4-chloroindolyl phosphate hydrolysis family protein n=1 Tax=Candidatus Flavonifractor merdigallinarum TaxID=2838589 RepID=A0A9D1YD58_9FIRM|nr:5-bromo-4-chloroindolyl phosphate hydrolysis family protein [Candidatus Flavonifractor merdigallinarum]